jgi:hypothetical protein
LRLEPYEGKPSSTVLRGGSGSNVTSLPDGSGAARLDFAHPRATGRAEPPGRARVRAPAWRPEGTPTERWPVAAEPGFLAPPPPRHPTARAGRGGAAKRRARGTRTAAGSRRPRPCPASVERAGRDAPHPKAPPARRPLPPEIGVRAGSAPPRRDARRFPWPGNAGVRAATARLRRCKFDFNNGYH